MHPADIIAGLKKAKHPPCLVAVELHRSPALISMVIHGHKTSEYVAGRIAAILKKKPQNIWPGKYQEKAA